MKKKVIILLNHFQLQDGVARAAIGMANALASEEVEVTLCPLFKCERGMRSRLACGVRLKRVFGFYFRGFSKIVDLIPDKLLYRLIVGRKYDVEIGYCLDLPLKIIAAGGNKNARRFGWIHGYDEGLTRIDCYPCFDKVIAVSRQNSERFAAETEGKIPTDYIYNITDDERILSGAKEPAELPGREGSFTFVTVGRLSPEKGFDRLIEIADRLKREGREFRILIIGDGPEREKLDKLIIETDTGDCVFLLGGKSNPHAYTAQADVFVCASYSEGYSTACTEAAVIGIPIITTEVGGAEEIISTACAGMVCKNDTDSLAQAMAEAVDHPETVAGWRLTLGTTKRDFKRDARVKRMHEVLGF